MLAYWDYYRSIEEDLITTTRFVEFCKENYPSYSIEFGRIIMAAGSELDMLFKVLCKKINPSSKADNINQYFTEVTAKFPTISSIKRYVRGYDLILQPFSAWTSENGPNWWSKGFNKIKHERNIYFDFANLENALNIVAGLMIVLFHYYSLEYAATGHFDLKDMPRLIIPYDPSNPDGTALSLSIDYLS